MWIDSHCHLNHSNITDKGSPSFLIAAAKRVGVGGMLTVCCKISEEFNELKDIISNNSNVWCSIGTHPHNAKLEEEKIYSSDRIAEMVSSNDNIIAIGETGLDYYYDYSPREDQEASFKKHIQACLKADVPMIVHTRDAEEDTARIMLEEGAQGNLRGVMHCYSSEKWLAEKALDIGFYISFSGMITFNKSSNIRDIAKIVPLDRVLIETDAPFLAPIPHRGKVNEPAFVSYTGEFLANLYNIPTEDFARITTDNFFRLFTKAKML